MKDQMHANLNNDALKAQLRLDGKQLSKIIEFIREHAEDDYSKSIGLLDIGAGYTKVIFYDRNTNEQVDKELLYPSYGEDVQDLTL